MKQQKNKTKKYFIAIMRCYVHLCVRVCVLRWHLSFVLADT